MSHLRFTPTHEWLDTATEIMTAGITHQAQSLLGDMVYIELPTLGAEIHAGDELGVLESVKAASEFYAPISGVIVAINEAAVANPSIVNSDPYGAGWLVKIEPHRAEDAFEEIAHLLKEADYLEDIAKEP